MMTEESESPVKSLTDQLSKYATYHRDRRNIATHLVGIPMIVVAVETLLARPVVGFLQGVPVSPALVVAVAATAYYLKLDRRFGLAMAVISGGAFAAASAIGSLGTAAWLGAGLGLFVVGWIIQFVGHAFEGKKPAFVDDLVGLLIGPLFVTAEIAFALGLRDEVREEIERRAGPTRRRTVVGDGASSSAKAS
jgi:uncharacterized membrane protein YGL010W